MFQARERARRFLVPAQVIKKREKGGPLNADREVYAEEPFHGGADRARAETGGDRNAGHRGGVPGDGGE